MRSRVGGVVAAGAVAFTMLTGLNACASVPGVASDPAPAAPAAGEVTAEVTSVEVRPERAARWLEVAGRIRGVAEDGGRCRFTFWAANGAASRLTATGVASDRAGAIETVCGPVSEEIGRIIPEGDYELELRYESDSSTVRSERTVVSISEDALAWD